MLTALCPTCQAPVTTCGGHAPASRDCVLEGDDLAHYADLDDDGPAVAPRIDADAGTS